MSMELGSEQQRPVNGAGGTVGLWTAFTKRMQGIRKSLGAGSPDASSAEAQPPAQVNSGTAAPATPGAAPVWHRPGAAAAVAVPDDLRSLQREAPPQSTVQGGARVIPKAKHNTVRLPPSSSETGASAGSGAETSTWPREDGHQASRLPAPVPRRVARLPVQSGMSNADRSTPSPWGTHGMVKAASSAAVPKSKASSSATASASASESRYKSLRDDIIGPLDKLIEGYLSGAPAYKDTLERDAKRRRLLESAKQGPSSASDGQEIAQESKPVRRRLLANRFPLASAGAVRPRWMGDNGPAPPHGFSLAQALAPRKEQDVRLDPTVSHLAPTDGKAKLRNLFGGAASAASPQGIVAEALASGGAGATFGMSQAKPEAASTPADVQAEGDSSEAGPIKVGKEDFWRVQLESIYRRRNHHKMTEIPALLEKYKGKEVLLYQKVCLRYDLNPEKFYADPSAWDDEDKDVKDDGDEPDGASVEQPRLAAPSLSFGAEAGGASLFGAGGAGSGASIFGSGGGASSLFGPSTAASSSSPSSDATSGGMSNIFGMSSAASSSSSSIFGSTSGGGANIFGKSTGEGSSAPAFGSTSGSSLFGSDGSGGSKDDKSEAKSSSGAFSFGTAMPGNNSSSGGSKLFGDSATPRFGNKDETSTKAGAGTFVFGSNSSTGKKEETPSAGGSSSSGIFGLNGGKSSGNDSKSPSIFGASDTKTPSIFGGGDSKPSNIFGDNDSKASSIFGGSDSQAPKFGTGDSQPASIFGGSDSKPPGIFGGLASSDSKPPNIFGAPAGSGSKPPPNIFGGFASSDSKSPSIFGGSAASSGSSLFGSAGLFGASSTGSSQNSIFGATATPAASSGLSGQAQEKRDREDDETAENPMQERRVASPETLKRRFANKPRRTYRRSTKQEAAPDLTSAAGPLEQAAVAAPAVGARSDKPKGAATEVIDSSGDEQPRKKKQFAGFGGQAGAPAAEKRPGAEAAEPSGASPFAGLLSGAPALAKGVDKPGADMAPAVPDAAGAEATKATAAGEEQDESEKVIKVDQGNFWQVQIEAIYRRRNPHKLADVPSLMEKHKEKPIILYRKVCKRYDLDPTKFYADPKAWEDEDKDVKDDDDEPSGAAGGEASSAGGFSFSATPATSPPAALGSLFGGTGAATGSGSLFGNFGAAAASSGGLFSSLPAEGASSGGGLFGPGGLFGNVGSSPNSGAASLFGTAAKQTGSSPADAGGESATTASIFGAASNHGNKGGAAGIFGAGQSASNGSGPLPAFGAPGGSSSSGSSLFGSAPGATTGASSIFGGFGSTSGSTQSGGSSFGGASGSTFGAKPAGTPSSSSSGICSADSTSGAGGFAFGGSRGLTSSAGSIFGAGSSSSGDTNAKGSGGFAFGGAAGASQSSIFGSTPSGAGNSSGSLFGAPPGNGGGIFGPSAAAAASSAAVASTSSATSGSPFAFGTQTGGTSLFGSPASSGGTGGGMSLFGTPAGSSGSSGGGLPVFGGAGAGSAGSAGSRGGFSFGAPSSTGGGVMFGSGPATTGGSIFGGMGAGAAAGAGGAGNSSTPLFGGFGASGAPASKPGGSVFTFGAPAAGEPAPAPAERSKKRRLPEGSAEGPAGGKRQGIF